MIDEGVKAIQAMADAAGLLSEYRGAEATRAMDDMLTRLAHSYQLQLVDVSVEELVPLQSKLKQTLAIRAVLRGEQPLPVI